MSLIYFVSYSASSVENSAQFYKVSNALICPCWLLSSARIKKMPPSFLRGSVFRFCLVGCKSSGGRFVVSWSFYVNLRPHAEPALRLVSVKYPHASGYLWLSLVITNSIRYDDYLWYKGFRDESQLLQFCGCFANLSLRSVKPATLSCFHTFNYKF